MPSIYQLKSQFQNILRPACNIFFKWGVTANQVTVFACVVSVVLGFGFYLLKPSHWFYLLIPVWMFVRMALNAIAGMLAREFNQKSHLGAFLNELTDIVSDTALFLLLFNFSYTGMPALYSQLMVLLFVFLSALTEMTGVVAQGLGAARRYDGPLGKSDRAFVLGAWCAVVAVFNVFSFSAYILLLLNFLLLFTVRNRIKQALTQLKNAA